MDLIDEHGNLFDKMYAAIADCDLYRIAELEELGMNIKDEQFWKSAIINNQLLVIVYQVKKGADVDKIIKFSEPKNEPLEIGNITFSGNYLIYKWATSYKSVNALNNKLPQKGNKSDKCKKI